MSTEWYALEDILVEWFGSGWNHVDALAHDPLKWFMRAYVASQFGDEVEDNFRLEISQSPDLMGKNPAHPDQSTQRA